MLQKQGKTIKAPLASKIDSASHLPTIKPSNIAIDQQKKTDNGPIHLCTQHQAGNRQRRP